jgi:hypothetical protein
MRVIQFVRMTTDKRTKIDVRAFIAFFGGPAAMRATWTRHKLELTKGAQDKWVMRGVVPTSRILEAVQVARAMRTPFDFNHFVKVSRRKK